MNSTRLRNLAGACLGAIMAITPAARAAIVNGTFAYVPFGDVTYTGVNLGNASSITIPNLELINGIDATYSGHPNDFYAGATALHVGGAVSVGALTLNPTDVNGGAQPTSLPSYLLFSSPTILGAGSSPTDRYEFTGTSITWTSSGADSLSFQMVGTLVDLGGYFSPDMTAQVSGSFTQTGGSGNANGSFTFADPVPAPEPTTMVAGAAAGMLVLTTLTARARR